MTSPDIQTSLLINEENMLILVEKRISALERELKRLRKIQTLLIEDPQDLQHVGNTPATEQTPVGAKPPARRKPDLVLVGSAPKTLTYHDLAHRIMLARSPDTVWTSKEINKLMCEHTGKALALKVTHCALHYATKLGLISRVRSSTYMVRRSLPRSTRKSRRANTAARKTK